MDVLTSVPNRDRINRYIHWTPDGEKALGSKQILMVVEVSVSPVGIGIAIGRLMIFAKLS